MKALKLQFKTPLPLLFGIGIIALALGLVAPTLSKQFATGLIEIGNAQAATSTRLKVIAPLQLSWQPSLILNHGEIIIDDTKLTKSRRSTSNNSRSPRNLSLLNSHFTLDNSTSKKQSKVDRGNEPRDIMAPLMGALTKFGFDTLDISNGTLVVISASGKATSKISAINARLLRSKSDQLIANGSMVFRGKRVTFNATLTQSRRGSSFALMPFSFELKNKLINISFKGRLSVTSGSQIQGTMNLSTKKLRQLAKWLIDDFPDGPALNSFSASGEINMIGNTYSFENSKFELDGNQISGGLTLNLEHDRPLFEGTLAANAINLDRYSPPAKSAARRSAVQQSTIAADSAALSQIINLTDSSANLSMPTLRYFDADVRLSAQTLKLGDWASGNAALAISLRDGKLLADIAEIEFAGGRANGQFSADMSGATPRFAIRSHLETTEISNFIDGFASASVLQGQGQLTVKLRGRGTTVKQLSRTVNGKLQLAMPDGGSIGVDPRAMFDAAEKSSFKGWNSVLGDTALQQMNVDLIAKNGVFRIASMTGIAQDRKISCRGKIDLPKQQVHMKVVIADQTQNTAQTPQTRQPPQNVMHIRGPWIGPKIWLEKR